jgi:hypothetical protein
MQICVVFAVHDGEVLCLGVRDPQQRVSRGFPISQGCRAVRSWSYVTIFSYCNFNKYVYIFTCGPYIHTFLVWPFLPKNRNVNHSVWLILYSKPLDLKCMKWIKSTLCCDCYTKINLFSYNASIMDSKDWSALQYWGCQNPVCEVCMQKSLFGDRLHNAWKETT